MGSVGEGYVGSGGGGGYQLGREANGQTLRGLKGSKGGERWAGGGRGCSGRGGGLYSDGGGVFKWGGGFNSMGGGEQRSKR